MKKIIKGILKIVFPKPAINGMENIKVNEYGVLVANHLGVFGPVWLMLYGDIKLAPWIISEMTDKKTCKKYLKEEFFQNELGWRNGVSSVVAAMIAPIVVCLLKEVNGIPVYHGSKGISETLLLSRKALDDGYVLLIFPEISPVGNPYRLRSFQTGFIRVGMEVCRSEGKGVVFYPVGVSKKNKRITIEKGIEYSCGGSYPVEKERIKLP